MKLKEDYFYIIRQFTLVLLVFLTPYGCVTEDKIATEIAQIVVDLDVDRFDRKFIETSSSGLSTLKKEYPYLFPAQYPDSIWKAKLKDSLQLELSDEVNNNFTTFKEEEENLELFFKHVRYYFPNYKLPKIVTVISDVDYSNRVILADSLLLIGLDNYLGADHKFYRELQRYIAFNLDKSFLLSDVASAFSQKVTPLPRERIFLAQLIYYGKELYIKDKLLPFQTDAQKIGYSKEQLDWALINEEQVWRYFVERELLYSTDNKLGPRFLDPAPFSKFQLELVDSESPGKIGRYIGWQIVKDFMKNTELELQQLLPLSAEEIFKKSNYKPKR